jgi:hypothetical protein
MRANLTTVTALQIEMLCDRGSNTTSYVPLPLFPLDSFQAFEPHHAPLMLTDDLKIHSGGPHGM